MSNKPTNLSKDEAKTQDDDLLALADATGVNATEAPAVETTAADDETFSPVPDASPTGRKRLSDLAIVALVAVVVLLGLIAAGIVGGSLGEKAAKKNEAAVTKYLEDQGATVDAVDCGTATCDAIIGGSAYKVLILDGKDGKKSYGVSAY